MNEIFKNQAGNKPQSLTRKEDYDRELLCQIMLKQGWVQFERQRLLAWRPHTQKNLIFYLLSRH